MFILLAIVSVIHGGICALIVPPPPYVETHREIVMEVKEIEDNILSMANHIPLLNDSRRHYAELINVIYEAAFETAHSCVRLDYTKIVEEASVEALSEPKKVIDKIQKAYTDLDAQTKTLQELIETVNAIKLSDVLANSMIDLIVKAVPEKYAEQARLYFQCGKAAKQFNKKKDLFKKLSVELNTHKFVVRKFETLMDLILDIAEVYPFPNLKC